MLENRPDAVRNSMLDAALNCAGAVEPGTPSPMKSLVPSYGSVVGTLSSRASGRRLLVLRICVGVSQQVTFCLTGCAIDI